MVGSGRCYESSLLAHVVWFALAAIVCAMSMSNICLGCTWRDRWATVLNGRHGFAVANPDDIFEQKEEPKTDEGCVFVSKAGKANLLVGAFENADH
jgi:hypothetical protein